ncbi:MAG: FkbM family methyltransferase [Kiritimatiellia bacterium]|nr:FkbM family methyltransferase [Kiritimatiellia bacterium]HOE36461.1 FkbM family methyltransferase [Kiritimatiellia bacterium]HOR73559.1 FkbM family methyltransferase [Kiritimatiellia bacterium]HOU60025.1 FkbM family methyltransferase [Kiritimatiellia bacterium]HPK69731.1 FkbM family methyltransferase [Kiritimatiellia bacterium]
MKLKYMINQFCKRRVYSAITRRGYSLFPDHCSLIFEYYVGLLVKKGNFTFVQIGANDGIMFDDVRNFIARHAPNASGLLVEPLPDVFVSLQKNYAPFPNVKAVNVAIHNKAKEMTLFRVCDAVAQTDRYRWMSGIASFSKQHLLSHGVRLEDIVEVVVPAMTYSELIAQHMPGPVGLLQIDTEGYDAEIVGQLDLGHENSPSIIRFEHNMIKEAGLSWAQMQDIISRLRQHGYEIAFEEADVLAYRPFALFEFVQA